MKPFEAPNPERRSDGALICFGAGAALTTLSWFLGVGGVMSTVLSGGDPVALAGGIGMLIALPLAAVTGIILMLAGGVWMTFRVVADSREADGKERYSRDVER